METILAGYVEAVGVRALVLLGLALAVFLTGVIEAVKAKAFEPRRLADFLGDVVLSKIGGWLIVASLAYFIKPAFIPDGNGITGDIFVLADYSTYALVFAGLASQVLGNIGESGVGALSAFARKP